MRRTFLAIALLATVLGCSGKKEAASTAPGSPALAGARALDPLPLARARSFQFGGGAAKAEKRESPIGLTSSDGAGLALVSLRADAVVDDPLAFTQLHLVFENPEDRIIEGQFRITLPVGATVSRFAMLTDGRWMEGEVVEKEAARRAYEDFLHRRQDPALLEQAGGNEFQARVFPIPARGRKEIILSYSQDLPRIEAPFHIPLRGLPELGTLDIRVRTGKGDAALVTDHKDRYVPSEDFVIPTTHRAARAGLRSGDLLVVRVRPDVSPEPDEIASLLVLVDSSASRGLGYDDQVRMVAALLAGLRAGAGPAVPLAIAGFDQEVALVYEGTVGGVDESVVNRLIDRRALGASNLEGALRWAGTKTGYRRVLLVGDGVVTAGSDSGEVLRAATKDLEKAGVERLDALVVGGIRDEARLGGLVAAGLPRDGAVIDSGLGLDGIAVKLTRRARSGLEVAVAGAEWLWPRTLPSVQAGDEVLVFASVPGTGAPRVTVGGRPMVVEEASLAEAERPLLERAAARARIAALSEERDLVPAEDSERRQKLKAQIVELSCSKRVLSPFTALLVLETEADYRRFNIDRRALADVMTVGPQGVVLLQRAENSVATLESQSPARPDRAGTDQPPSGADTGEDVRQAGVLRVLSAEGSSSGLDAKDVTRPSGQASGYGIGAGGGMRGRSATRPSISIGTAVAQGDLDRNTIRRYVRQKLPQIQYCYERELITKPTLVGTVNVQFTINPNGQVVSASASGMDTVVAGCVREVVLSIQFPKINGTVNVTSYPFTFLPTGEPGVPALRQEDRSKASPYAGKMAQVMSLLETGKPEEALAKAREWRSETPGDVLALIALGEVLEKLGDGDLAARAYGSLIDLFPQRADLRRFAGERLERIAGEKALTLAVDTYRRAAENRPDHPAGHRLLGFALLRSGKPAEAFAAIEKGLQQDYPANRFAGVREILAEDLGLVAAAWIKVAPSEKKVILERLEKAGGRVENGPSLRFVLNWETDANDVDFHIHDAQGNHAFYSQMELASGGRLYADVTTGYGPECFTIRTSRKARPYPYKLEAHYYSRGPMGYGMGKLEIIEHDGAGELRFEERPFVIMQDSAYVQLGSVGAKVGK